MPLIIISGYPCSGKSHRAQQIQKFFDDRIKSSTDAHFQRLTVHVVSDESLKLNKDDYRDAKLEKNLRAAEYSTVKRLMGRDAIVIADGLNYIKGFRYQLYCDAKAVRTPSCVVHVGTPINKCRDNNNSIRVDGHGGYPPDVFDNLVYRYEEPNGMTRWDSPLFTVLWDDETPPCEKIWEQLIGSEQQVKSAKPNAATVNSRLPESDYLYELDKTTQGIVIRVMEWQKDHPGEGDGEVCIDSSESSTATVNLPPRPATLPLLQRLRRQFIAMNRQHQISRERIRGSFIDYLNDNFNP